MTEEEGWITYGLDAIENVLEKGILWKKFREAIRIMKLIPHDHALKTFKNSQSRNHHGTPKGLNVQSRPLRISTYHGLLYLLLAKRTLNIFV